MIKRERKTEREMGEDGESYFSGGSYYITDRQSEGRARGGEAFIKKYWYPPGCDFEGPLVLPLYRLHGLPVVLHRYPVFRINITQVPVYTHSIRTTLHQPSKVFHGSVGIKHSHRIVKITSENIFRHYNSM